jgi:leucyl-tRNA synthetase
MSKSKGNTIEPDGIINEGYGADSIRLMELFIGPWNQAANWSVEGMGGTYRFLQRVWTLVGEFKESGKGEAQESADIRRAVHKAIKKVTEDLRSLSFNTAIAAQMELINELYRLKVQDGYGSEDWSWACETLLQLLAPFAPHITEELWYELGHKESIHTGGWPSWDEKYLVTDTLTIAVQVNGKLRGQVEVPTGADEASVIEKVHADNKIAAHLEGKKVKKTIYVPARLVNFVV